MPKYDPKFDVSQAPYTSDWPRVRIRTTTRVVMILSDEWDADESLTLILDECLKKRRKSLGHD